MNSQASKFIGGAPATLTVYDAAGSAVVSGYVSPLMDGQDLTHNADSELIRNSLGEVVGVVTYNNNLELTISYIPAATHSVANAKLSASLPDAGGTVVIADAPVVEIGGYTDALNAATGNRWIYKGGGSIKTTATGVARMTLPLVRFAGITASGAATTLGG
jgi:hypothetical protein